MKPFAFEAMLLCLLACMVYPVALLGTISTDLARHERLALIVSAGVAFCLAGAWVAILL